MPSSIWFKEGNTMESAWLASEIVLKIFRNRDRANSETEFKFRPVAWLIVSYVFSCVDSDIGFLSLPWWPQGKT